MRYLVGGEGRPAFTVFISPQAEKAFEVMLSTLFNAAFAPDSLFKSMINLPLIPALYSLLFPLFFFLRFLIPGP